MILAITQEQAHKLAAVAKAAGTDQIMALTGMKLRWALSDDGQTVEFEAICTTLHVTALRGFDIPATECRNMGDNEQKGSIVVTQARFLADALKEIGKMAKAAPLLTTNGSRAPKAKLLLEITADSLRLTSEQGKAVYDFVLHPTDLFPSMDHLMPGNVQRAYSVGRRDVAALKALRFESYLPTLAMAQIKRLIESTGDSMAKTAEVFPFYLIPPTVGDGKRARWAFMSVRPLEWWVGLVQSV